MRCWQRTRWRGPRSRSRPPHRRGQGPGCARSGDTDELPDRAIFEGVGLRVASPLQAAPPRSSPSVRRNPRGTVTRRCQHARRAGRNVGAGQDLQRAVSVSEPACHGPRTAALLGTLIRPRRSLGARPIHIPFPARRASDPDQSGRSRRLRRAAPSLGGHRRRFAWHEPAGRAATAVHLPPCGAGDVVAPAARTSLWRALAHAVHDQLHG